MRKVWVRSLAAALIAVGIAGAPASAQSVTDDGAYPVAFQDRMTLVAPARAEAERQLGRPVELKVSSLLYKSSWVFLLSTMVDAKGEPLDLTGTNLGEAVREGVASRVFCALLRWDAGRWMVVASCLGATDVAWAEWAEKYHAPPEIFELQNAD